MVCAVYPARPHNTAFNHRRLYPRGCEKRLLDAMLLAVPR